MNHHLVLRQYGLLPRIERWVYLGNTSIFFFTLDEHFENLSYAWSSIFFIKEKKCIFRFYFEMPLYNMSQFPPPTYMHEACELMGVPAPFPSGGLLLHPDPLRSHKHPREEASSRTLSASVCFPGPHLWQLSRAAHFHFDFINTWELKCTPPPSWKQKRKGKKRVLASEESFKDETNKSEHAWSLLCRL